MSSQLIHLFIFICILINLLLLYFNFDQINLSDEPFLNLNKCPFCYGTSLCDDIKFKLKYDFKISNSFFLNTYFFERLLNIKNVYFVRDSLNEKLYVFKKLGHDDELNEFDANEKFKNLLNSNFKLLTFKMNLTVFKKYSNELDIEISKCFSQRLLDLMYEKYQEANLSPEKTDYLKLNLYLMTSLKINPEPIVLQMLSDSFKSMPKYIGSCGRVIVESYEGLTLNHYLDHSIYFRIKIVKNFLQELVKLTYNDFEIGVYLLDLGLENIAYDESDEQIKFIDVENVILTDKKQIIIENKLNWNDSFSIAQYDDCNGLGSCLKYNIKEMCTSYHVDINFYSACRNVLSELAIDVNTRRNFLHSVPLELDMKFKINYLLDKCSKWSLDDNQFGNRLEIVNLLIDHLNKIENEFSLIQ